MSAEIQMSERVEKMLMREMESIPPADSALFFLALHVVVYELLMRNVESAVLAGYYDVAIEDLEKMRPEARH